MEINNGKKRDVVAGSLWFIVSSDVWAIIWMWSENGFSRKKYRHEKEMVKINAVIPNKLKTNSLIFNVNVMYMPKKRNMNPINRYIYLLIRRKACLTTSG